MHATHFENFRNSNVTIFGGSGFVGRHLANKLIQHGARVTIADIEPPSASAEKVKYEFCDIRKPIEIKIDKDCDLVVNLAAVHRTPGHEPHEYYETNVQGTEHILGFCRTNGVQELWFTSSIAVYGPRDEEVDEQSSLYPTSPYGMSKLQAEQLIQQWANEAPERRSIICRPAVIFGPDENGNFTRLANALSKRYFFYPGTRSTRKACGYVGDLVDAFGFVSDKQPKLLIFNFAYENAPTIEDICLAFNEVAGYPAPKLTVPKRALLGLGEVLQVLGARQFDPERIEKLTKDTNIKPKVLMQEGFEWNTNLKMALSKWLSERPHGRFI